MKGIHIVMVIVLSITGYNAAFCAETSRRIQATLDNAGTASIRLDAGQNTLLLDRQTYARPTASKSAASATDLIVVGMDSDNNELSRQVIDNPLYFHAETFDPANGEIAFSGIVRENTASLDIIVPEHPELNRVDIYEFVTSDNNTLTPVFLQSIQLEALPAVHQQQFEEPPPGVYKVIDNGPSENRVDLVFLSEGYTDSQLDRFDTDVNDIISGFFAESPFFEYQNYFNVWRVEVASEVSGAGTGSPRDTAFGAYFNCGGLVRLVCADQIAIINYIANVLSAEQADQVVLVVNSERYGGSGGVASVITLAPEAIDLALHEVGHSFGKLADEYSTFVEGGCVIIDRMEANVTPDPTGNRWAHWFSAPRVGVYEGARYCREGLYRPTRNSMMRTLGVPFYEVNEEQLVKRIYDYVDLIGEPTPAGKLAILKAGEQITFSLDSVSTETNSVETVWLLNGTPVGNDEQLTLAADNLNSGFYTLEAEVTDLTEKILNDPDNVTHDRISWNLFVATCNPLALTRKGCLDRRSGNRVGLESGSGLVSKHFFQQTR